MITASDLVAELNFTYAHADYIEDIMSECIDECCMEESFYELPIFVIKKIISKSSFISRESADIISTVIEEKYGSADFLKNLNPIFSNINTIPEKKQDKNNGKKLPKENVQNKKQNSGDKNKRKQNPNQKGNKDQTQAKNVKSDKSILFEAIDQNDMQKAKKVIEKNPSVLLETDQNKCTPLIHAIMKKSTDVAKLIIRNSDVQGIEYECTGKTPIHFAVETCQLQIVRSLIEKGCNIEFVNKNNQKTPFFVACERGFKEIAELLIENEADINALSQNGNTALHIAAQNSLYDIVQMLLKHGADVNSLNSSNRTPLMLAAEKKKNKGTVVLLLKEENIDINAVDNDGNTALMRAALVNNQKFIETLAEMKENEIDFSIKNKQGQDVFAILAVKNPELMDALKEFEQIRGLE